MRDWAIRVSNRDSDSAIQSNEELQHAVMALMDLNLLGSWNTILLLGEIFYNLIHASKLTRHRALRLFYHDHNIRLGGAFQILRYTVGS